MKRFVFLVAFLFLLIIFFQKTTPFYAASTCSNLGQACNNSPDCCSTAPVCKSGLGGSGACETGNPVDQCQGPGATYTISNPCCIGDTPINGVCQQNTCSTLGQPCAFLTGGNNPTTNCCGGLTCDVSIHGHCITGGAGPLTPTPPNPCPSDNGLCKTIDTAVGPIDVSSPGGFVKAGFGIMLSISGAIAIIIIIFAGYGIMFSQGDPEKIKANQEQLTSAIIGLLFMIFSVTILHIIGYDVFRFPGF